MSQPHTPRIGEETGIDLAPMLDFVLNLLIFFIITTSFVREAGITVDRGRGGHRGAQGAGNILIAIRPNGEIWMDRRQVDMREVRPIVERLHIERPEDTVVVIADKAAQDRPARAGDGRGEGGGIKEVAIGAQNPAGG